MMYPVISVLIPVYKAEQYIAKCLDSCLSNSMAAFCEFIIVDDCSPDKSIERAKSVVENYPYLKNNFVWLRHGINKGVAASRNTALSNAHGTFIANVDADDWVEPMYFEQLYKKATEDNADIVICNYFEENGKKSKSKLGWNKKNDSDALIDLVSNSITGYLWNKLLRKSVIETYKIQFAQNINIWEDFLFLFKIFSFSKKTTFLKQALYHYRKTPGTSITQNFTPEKYSQILDTLFLVKAFSIEKNLYTRIRESYLQRSVVTKIIHIGKLPLQNRNYENFFTDEECSFVMKESKNGISKVFVVLIIHRVYFIVDFIFFVFSIVRGWGGV